jgi:four helix bundle protein
MVNNFKELNVWKDSIKLVKDIYQLTKSFPRIEDYTLTSQIRRSAISIPSNIAEGAGKSSTAEYIRFVDISLGSLAELETQVIISFELEYISKEQLDLFLNDINKIGTMIGAMKISLEKKKITSLNKKSLTPITNTNHQ